MRRFIAPAQVHRFLPAQEGATAIEYALIASGIAGALIVGLTAVGASVTKMWTTVANLF